MSLIIIIPTTFIPLNALTNPHLVSHFLVTNDENKGLIL